MIDIQPNKIYLNIIYKGKRDKLLGELTTPEQLETLFNAIVP